MGRKCNPPNPQRTSHHVYGGRLWLNGTRFLGKSGTVKRFGLIIRVFGNLPGFEDLYLEHLTSGNAEKSAQSAFAVGVPAEAVLLSGLSTLKDLQSIFNSCGWLYEII